MNAMFNRLGEVNEVQSSIPLRMKCIFTLDVKTNSSLQMKKRTLVITNCEASSDSKGKIKEEEQASFGHITVWEADELEAEVKPP